MMDHRQKSIGPLTLGSLIRRTLSLYLDHFRTLVGITALALVPTSIIRILLDLVARNSDDLLATFLLGLFGLIIALAAGMAAFAGVVSATAQAALHGQTSVMKAFDYSIDRVGALIKSSFLVFGILFALAVTIIGIPIAIFLLIAWAVVGQVVVLEGESPRVALGRSWELTRGNRLRVLGLAIVVGFLTGLATLAFEAPGIALVLREVLRGSGNPPPEFGWVAADIFSVLGTILILPIQYCAWTLLYFDLVARAEQPQATGSTAATGFDPSPLPGMD
jgi:hypothetical protein